MTRNQLLFSCFIFIVSCSAFAAELTTDKIQLVFTSDWETQYKQICDNVVRTVTRTKSSGYKPTYHATREVLMRSPICRILTFFCTRVEDLDNPQRIFSSFEQQYLAQRKKQKQ